MTTPPSRRVPRPAVSLPDLLVALGVTLLGLVLLLGSLQIPFGINAVVGPRVFPLIVSVGLLALGAVLTLNVLRGERAEPAAEEDTDPDAPVRLGPPALILGGLVVGALILPSLGFVPGTALMYVSVAAALGERRWPLVVGIALVLSLVTYLVFTRGLGLTLPAGVLRGVL